MVVTVVAFGRMDVPISGPVTMIVVMPMLMIISM